MPTRKPKEGVPRNLTPAPSPRLQDKTRVCTGPCGLRLPTSADYFDVDRHREDGLKTICKQCRANARKVDHDAEIIERVKSLDKGAIRLIDALTKVGASIPHMTELYQRLMDAFDGAGGFASHFMGQYLMAAPGSNTRTKMLETVLRLGIRVSEDGGAAKPINLMEDEELHIVFEQGAKNLLRLTHDDGEVKEAS